ncbi:hypothetical protein [Caulobacter sp. RL271]|nr:hypothetical protein [Caulobacter segnis]
MSAARAHGWSIALTITAISGLAFHAAWTLSIHLLASPAGHP